MGTFESFPPETVLKLEISTERDERWSDVHRMRHYSFKPESRAALEQLLDEFVTRENAAGRTCSVHDSKLFLPEEVFPELLDDGQIN